MNEHVITSEYLLIYLLLITFTLILQYNINKIWKISNYISESCAAMLIGLFIGFIISIYLKYRHTHTFISNNQEFDPSLLGFSNSIFYFGFLPPIIFNTGYHLKRLIFFSNFGAIFSLSIIGTLISSFCMFIVLLVLYQNQYLPSLTNFTIMELLAFAALISSTDPVSTLAVYSKLKVDPLLYYLVLGESILNDSICIILFNTAAKYVGYSMTTVDISLCILQFFISFLGSTLIGYGIGILIATLYRHINFLEDSITSIGVLLSIIYLPFFLCETLELSGIVAILFAGISTRRYLNKNITIREKYLASFIFQLLALYGDTSCFCLLGISIFSNNTYRIYQTHSSLFLWVLFLCIIGRAINVYPMLSLVNLYRIPKKKRLISSNHMHMIFLSGLRGSVSFALANIFPNTNGNRDIVLNITSNIILITVAFGCLTEYIIKVFDIKTNVDLNEYISEMKKEYDNNQPSNNPITSPISHSYLSMDQFERNYIYPFVLKNPYDNSLNIETESLQLQLEDIDTYPNSIHSSGGGTLFGDDDSNSDTPSVALTTKWLSPKYYYSPATNPITTIMRKPKDNKSSIAYDDDNSDDSFFRDD